MMSILTVTLFKKKKFYFKRRVVARSKICGFKAKFLMELRAVSLMICVSISLCSPLLPPRLLLDMWLPRFGWVGWFPRISSFAVICENKWLTRALCLCGGEGRAFGNSPVRRAFREIRQLPWLQGEIGAKCQSLPDSRKSDLEATVHGKPGLFLSPMKHVFKVTAALSVGRLQVWL